MTSFGYHFYQSDVLREELEFQLAVGLIAKWGAIDSFALPPVAGQFLQNSGNNTAIVKMNLAIVNLLEGFVSATGNEHRVTGSGGMYCSTNCGFAIGRALHMSGCLEATADVFNDLQR